MKTVFASKELPHIWAHRQAPHGRSPGAMSFDGDDFLSYTTTIARLHGPDVVFINNTHYSNTTSGHQSAVRQAIPGSLTVFQGPTDCISSPLVFVRAMMDMARRAKQRGDKIAAEHPRRKSQIAAAHAQCVSLIAEAKRCNEHCDLGENCSMEGIASMQAARAVREKEVAAAAKRQLAKWIAGEDVSTYGLPSGQTYLRLQAGKVQTSKGIELDLLEAIRALAFVQSKRAGGWHRNGDTFPVAGYQLDSVTADGVVAGCHRLSWHELDRFAKVLKGVLA